MADKTARPTREKMGRVGHRRQIVIPLEIFEKLQMREGDLVAFSRKGNGLLVLPKRPIDPDDMLTPDDAKRVRTGEAQLKRGESTPWLDVKRRSAT